MRSALMIALVIQISAIAAIAPASAASAAVSQKGLKFIVTPSGLRYAVTKRADGPLAKPGQVIVYSYVARRPDGTVFKEEGASSPALPRIIVSEGRGSELPGVYEGLLKLREGESAVLVIPPDIGVGRDAFAPWGLPANSTVTYEVEVQEFKDTTLKDLMGKTLAKGGLAAAARLMDELRASNFENVYKWERELGNLSFGYLYRTRTPEIAIQLAKWNTELYPTDKSFTDLGDAHFISGNTTEAIAAYSRAVEFQPKLAGQNVGKRLARLKAGDPSLALDRIKDLLSNAGEYPSQFPTIPIDLAYLGAQLDQFVKASPENAAQVPQLLRKLSTLYDAEGARQRQLFLAGYGNSADPQIQRALAREAELARLAQSDARVHQSEIGKPIDLKFMALDGRQVDLNDLRGKVVLLGFWLTPGQASRINMRYVKKLYDRYRPQGFEVIGITVDGPMPNSGKTLAQVKEDVVKFLANEQINWPTHHEGEKGPIAKRFAASGFPTLILIDKSGTFAENVSLTREELEPSIERLLR